MFLPCFPFRCFTPCFKCTVKKLLIFAVDLLWFLFIWFAVNNTLGILSFKTHDAFLTTSLLGFEGCSQKQKRNWLKIVMKSKCNRNSEKGCNRRRTISFHRPESNVGNTIFYFSFAYRFQSFWKHVYASYCSYPLRMSFSLHKICSVYTSSIKTMRFKPWLAKRAWTVVEHVFVFRKGYRLVMWIR